MEVAPPALNNSPQHVRTGSPTAKVDAGWFNDLEWITHGADPNKQSAQRQRGHRAF